MKITAIDDLETEKRYGTGDLDLGVPTASLVKLLIAVELRAQGADRMDLLTAMLQRSDDDAANTLWDEYSGVEIVRAAARRLGLTATEPPTKPNMWGWATMSAADLCTTMRYLRTDDVVMAALRTATPLGADGFDQSFGLYSPGTPVKQGWMVMPDGVHYLHSVAVLSDRFIGVVLASGSEWTDTRAVVDAGAAEIIGRLSKL